MNTALPKISIVTASFNQAKFLETAILSVLDQRYPNLEYIIIDGGSSDGSLDIIQKYAEHLTFWVSEKDNGQYDAINRGFAKSTGEIMAFLNADDFYLPYTLRTVASIFSSTPNVEWLTALAPLQTNAEGLLFASGIINPISRNAFMDGLYIPGVKESVGVIVQEGTFWARSLWEKTGANINVTVNLAGDFDLWCRFFRFSEPYCIGYPLAAMSRHKDQRSNLMALYIEQCHHSLSMIRQQLGYKLPNKKRKHYLLKAYRLNSITWAIGKRLLGYYAWVLDAALDEDFNVKWKANKIHLYIK